MMSSASSDKNRRIALVIGRFILAGIFLVSSYAKLRPQIPDTPWSVASVKTSLSFFSRQSTVSLSSLWRTN